MTKPEVNEPPAPKKFTAVKKTLAIAAFIAGASFCIAGDQWHSQPSFFYINELPLPWWLYGAVLLLAACFIFVEKTRPVGFLLGAILYSFFAIAVWLAVLGGFHLNVAILGRFPNNTVGSFFAAGNITTVCVLYWSELKSSIYVQVNPERAKKLE